jgi:subtilase family serine protease
MVCRSKSARFAFAVAALALGTALTAHAEKRQLVTSKINDNVLTTLSGNTRPEAVAKNDRGLVSPELRFNHMLLILKRPAELDAQLTKLIDDMHDPKSPSFHKWMGAEEFGTRFGPASSDVETVRHWLEGEGFSVNVVYANGMFIDFSGTARQVETTFHTEIHNYEVNGEVHYANSRDPQIPAALRDVVHGVTSLNNFRPKAMHEKVHEAQIDPKGGNLKTAVRGAKAEYDNAHGQEIVPYDLEKIYNIAPLLTAGTSGQGMKIVVLEDTDLYNCNASNTAGPAGTACSATSDWAVFRNTFGLGRYTAGNLAQSNPAPQTGANNCSDPGDNGDDVEAAIDVQWATAAAPSASIVNASCNDTSAFGGTIALLNILSHPNADNVDVVSMSYGESEEDSGAALNASFNTAFQQAVAAGIGIFVSSGDELAASSDADRASATHGITISGWMSSQYDVSVGGLDFADTYLGENADYWLPANNVYYGSAKSYIPEQPWNDSCAGTLLSTYVTGSPVTYGSSGFCNTPTGEEFLEVGGGSGGPSGCATGSPKTSGVDSGTCAGYTKPTYQSSNIGKLAGLVNDGVRDTPDVSLMAANGLWGHYYVICYSNAAGGGVPCTGQPVNWPGYGGTSVSSPIFAAIQALVVQHKGSLQGNPNPRYYALAATEYGPTGSASCNSSEGAASGNSCIFHDVTLGDIDVNCKALRGTLYNCYLPSGTNGVLSTSNSAYQPAYPTTTGWDFGSGIGSVNAYNLVMAY